jgi:hypothetical protein
MCVLCRDGVVCVGCVGCVGDRVGDGDGSVVVCWFVVFRWFVCLFVCLFVSVFGAKPTQQGAHENQHIAKTRLNMHVLPNAKTKQTQ